MPGEDSIGLRSDRVFSKTAKLEDSDSRNLLRPRYLALLSTLSICLSFSMVVVKSGVHLGSPKAE